MPPATVTSRTLPRPSRPRVSTPAAVSLVIIFAISACGGGDDGTALASTAEPATATTMPEESMSPMASGDIGANICTSAQGVAEQLAGLRAIELRLPNRVALDIELGKVQAAYNELRQADLGELEERLEDPLKRLGYRIDELKLAVEDFRTNPRPKRAAPHVETDSEVVSDAVSSFGILASCDRF
jgi:hypothetical protein